MFRISKRVLALGLASVLLHSAGLRAAEEALAIVTGIASGDLLNVRATASPLGHTMTRLPNGAAVKNFGCGEFNNYQWCKIEVVDQPGISGWVPARYLLAVDPEGTATTAMPALNDDDMKAATADVAAAAVSEQGDTGGEKDVSTAPAVPPDLAARFGDGPSNAGTAGASKKAPQRLTEEEINAYRLAFAAREKAAASARQDAASDAGQPITLPADGDASVTDDEGSQTTPQEKAAVAGVPVPTPRPDEAEISGSGLPKADANDDTAIQAAPAPPATGQTAEPPAAQIALADPRPDAEDWDATGEIPCARYAGQPMTRCRVGIKRAGAGKADVTVIWPDGGTSVIRFDKGQPVSAEPPGKFRFLRESGLNMIRVGASERFEITDKLAFGD